jgi:Spy/CpxP family protein refolding chaperone
MRSPFKMVLALAVFGLLVAPALAQRPGGFGFGFGGPQAGPALLLNKSVQDELKLSDEVKSKLTKINEKQNEKRREAFQSAAGDFEKIREEMQKIGEATNKEVTQIIDKDLKPEQAKRFKQIKVQVAGVQAFLEPDVQKELKLTDKQKADAKAAIDDVQKDVRELFQEAQGNPEKMREVGKKVQALRQEAFDKVAGTLSADQKKTWAEMTGPKFELKLEPIRRPGGGQ